MKECTNRVTPAMAEMVEKLAQRELTVPLLLCLVGHKPLAFVTGQFLYLFLPIATLTGFAHLGDWARLLSDPTGPMQLEALLGDYAKKQPI